MVVAYLIKNYSMGLEDALAYAKRKRKLVIISSFRWILIKPTHKPSNNLPSPLKTTKQTPTKPKTTLSPTKLKTVDLIINLIIIQANKNQSNHHYHKRTHQKIHKTINPKLNLSKILQSLSIKNKNFKLMEVKYHPITTQDIKQDLLKLIRILTVKISQPIRIFKIILKKVKHKPQKFRVRKSHDTPHFPLIIRKQYISIRFSVQTIKITLE